MLPKTSAPPPPRGKKIEKNVKPIARADNTRPRPLACALRDFLSAFFFSMQLVALLFALSWLSASAKLRVPQRAFARLCNQPNAQQNRYLFQPRLQTDLLNYQGNGSSDWMCFNWQPRFSCIAEELVRFRCCTWIGTAHALA